MYCLVDSLTGVAAMTEAAGAVTRPIPVLIELGVTGGRTGCRSFKEAEQVADAVARSPALELVGVEGYEGSLKTDDMAQTITTVDDYLNRLRSLTIELAQRGAFPTRREIIVSAGGSGLFDRVVEKLAPRWNLDHPVRVVIRPGSYIAHDSGEAEHISPLGGRSTSGDRLRAALEVWGAVLSRQSQVSQSWGSVRETSHMTLGSRCHTSSREKGFSGASAGSWQSWGSTTNMRTSRFRRTMNSPSGISLDLRSRIPARRSTSGAWCRW